MRDENLCHLFSPEKCPVIVKRSRILEIVSNLRNYHLFKPLNGYPNMPLVEMAHFSCG